MDDENYVHNNNYVRAKFNELLKKVGQKEYTESTIHKCFSKLNKSALIDTVDGVRGLYQVNPLFFFNGSEEQREILIRRNLERPFTKSLKEKRHKELKEMNSKNRDS